MFQLSRTSIILFIIFILNFGIYQYGISHKNIIYLITSDIKPNMLIL